MSDLVEEGSEHALAVALDVTDAGQIAAAVATATERFGRIDVLVNNAGYGYQSSVEEGEEDAIRAQFDANVFGLFAMTRAVLPLMRDNGGGARGQRHLDGGGCGAFRDRAITPRASTRWRAGPTRSPPRARRSASR